MSYEDDRALSDSEEVVLEPSLLKAMEAYIVRNCDVERVEPYPQAWMGDIERATFGKIAEKMMGETQCDRWLQNKVFRNLASDSDWDFDRPIDVTEVQSVPLPEVPTFDPLALSFIERYGKFISNLTSKMSNLPRLRSDEDRVFDGWMAGVAYALNAPRDGNMDQRINFFAIFPSNLTFEEIKKYTSKDESLAVRTYERIRAALINNGFTFKTSEETTEAENAQGITSIHVAGNKQVKRRDALREAILPLAADSSPNAGDGLLSLLARIIESGQCESLCRFVAYHIEKRTLSERTKEGKRKQHEVSIYHDDDDGCGEDDSEISQTEEVTDKGVIVSSAAFRHAYARKETYEERRGRAEQVMKVAIESFDATKSLVDQLSKTLEAESIEKCKQLLAGNKPTNRSTILGLLLPEALHYYIVAADEQITSLIRPEKESALQDAYAKGLRLIYRDGRSYIGFTRNGNRDLGSVVDIKSLETYLEPYRKQKKAIYAGYMDGKEESVIAQELGVDITMVKNTIRQIRVFRLSPMQCRRAVWAEYENGMTAENIVTKLGLSAAEVNESIVAYRDAKEKAEKKGKKENIGLRFEDFFDELTAANIKNGFSWRWGRILAILFDPIKNDPQNEAIIDAEAKRLEANNVAILAEQKRRLEAQLSVLDILVTRKTENDRLLAIYREGKRYEFLDELLKDGRKILLRRRVRRTYMMIERDALRDLESLLSVHSSIRDGNIPNRVYPEGEENKPLKEIRNIKGLQPGIVFGHNVCRATGETNLRMFYDIFYGGLKRDCAAHKGIRDRAALIMKMRRAKAAKHGGDAGAPEDNFDPDTNA